MPSIISQFLEKSALSTSNKKNSPSRYLWIVPSKPKWKSSFAGFMRKLYKAWSTVLDKCLSTTVVPCPKSNKNLINLCSSVSNYKWPKLKPLSGNWCSSKRRKWTKSQNRLRILLRKWWSIVKISKKKTIIIDFNFISKSVKNSGK